MLSIRRDQITRLTYLVFVRRKMLCHISLKAIDLTLERCDIVTEMIVVLTELEQDSLLQHGDTLHLSRKVLSHLQKDARGAVSDSRHFWVGLLTCLKE